MRLAQSYLQEEKPTSPQWVPTALLGLSLPILSLQKLYCSEKMSIECCVETLKIM